MPTPNSIHIKRDFSGPFSPAIDMRAVFVFIGRLLVLPANRQPAALLSQRWELPDTLEQLGSLVGDLAR